MASAIDMKDFVSSKWTPASDGAAPDSAMPDLSRRVANDPAAAPRSKPSSAEIDDAATAAPIPPLPRHLKQIAVSVVAVGVAFYGITTMTAWYRQSGDVPAPHRGLSVKIVSTPAGDVAEPNAQIAARFAALTLALREAERLALPKSDPAIAVVPSKISKVKAKENPPPAVPAAVTPVAVASAADAPLVAAQAADGPLVAVPAAVTPLAVAPAADGPLATAPPTVAPLAVAAPAAVAPLAVVPAAVAPATTETTPAPSAPSEATVAEITELLARGDGQLASGNIAAARLFYDRAASLGSGRAATMSGKTYDPRFLATIPVSGIAPDQDQAAVWYRRGAALGDGESVERLAGLTGSGQ